ncbi:MAG: helix-turn-helix transcriptional regulator, partial [Oscillospiraceae bacterium]|nr:helix-turn-helix transcriptional regulator [Oscillospiraceae bacterium]
PREGWAEAAALPCERRAALPPRVEQVRSYIQEHFCEELSLEDIANACDMSKYYLCHVFKENMGISAFNYLIWLHMEEARRLLATTSLKVAQVGLQVGYSDPNYFITAFKKQEGMTPTEYRIGQRSRLAAAE